MHSSSQQSASSPAGPANRFPLSFQQESLWAATRVDPDSPAYNCPVAFRIHGKVDRDALECGISILIARHETLRTALVQSGGEPMQFVADSAFVPVLEHELTGSPWDREEELAEFVAARSIEPFDLGRPPLLRAFLIRTAESESVLLLIFHHLVFDAGSLSVFLSELAACYEAIVGGTRPELPDLPIQYGDYAAWQTQHAAIEDSLAFWRKQLAGATATTISGDLPPASAPSLAGRRVSCDVNPDLLQAAAHYCRARGVTPAAFWLTLYHVLLASYTGSDDILVGVSAANRDRSETDRMIGLLVSTLPIRADLSGNPTFLQLLLSIRDTLVKSYAHRETPPARLQARIAAAYSWTPSSPRAYTLAGMPVQAVETSTLSSKFDLSMIVSGDWSRAHVTFEYRTDRFSPEAGARILEDYMRLLAAFARQPEARIRAVALFQDEVARELQLPVERVCRLSPLAPTQRDLWLGTLSGSQVGFNLAAVLPLGRDIDDERWLRAVRTIAGSVEVSRLRYAICHGQPWQFVDPDLPLDVRLVEVERTADFLDQLIATPVDLRNGPPVRYLLVKEAGGERTAVMAGHHIAFDAHSANAFFQSVAAFYADPHNAQDSQQPSFLDTIADEIARFDSSSTIAYWTERFRQVQPVERYRPDGDSQPACASLTVSDEDVVRFRAAAADLGCSLANFVLGAYGIALRHLQKEPADFLVYNVVSGRSPASTHLIGCRYHVLPRVFPQSWFNADSRGYFQHLQSYRRNVGEHGCLSRLAQSRLMDDQELRFLYNFYNCSVVTAAGEPRPLRFHQYYAEDELHFSVEDFGDELLLSIHYNATQFSDARLPHRVVSILRQLADSVPVNEIGTLLPEELGLLAAWNSTGREPLAGSTMDLFEAQVRATPLAIAVRYEDCAWTYQELDREASRIAHALASHGIGPEDVVLALSGRNHLLLAVLLGVWKAGAVYLPLDPDHPLERLATVARGSSAKAILFADDYGETAASICAGARAITTRISIETVLRTASGTHFPARIAGPDSLAYVFYTSGSTGEPKGAMIHHAGMHNHLRAKVEELQLDAHSVVVQCSSQCFDVSIWQFVSALVAGGEVYIANDREARDPIALLHAASIRKATVLEVVPSQIAFMVQELDRPTTSKPDLSHLHILISNAEMLTSELAGRWMRHYPDVRLLNAYGPTECSDDVAHETVLPEHCDAHQRNIWVGHRLRNTQIYVLSPHGALVPPLAIGEVYIGGIGVGRGYCNDPVRTAAAFLPDPFSAQSGARLYRTGDLGRLHADGRLEVLGRVDHQVKIRGHRIELGEIEAALQSHSLVDRAIVEVRPARDGEPTLVAFIVALHPSQWDGAAVRAHVAERVPVYMLPAAMVLLDELPLNDNGKVNRRALHWDGEVQHTATEAPVGETELRMAQLWSEALGMAGIGRHDNFFSLGGHSLLAIRLISRIREQLGAEVPVQTFWQRPSIAALAACLDSASTAGDGIPALPRGPHTSDWRLASPAIAAAMRTDGHAAQWNCFPMSPAQRRLWLAHTLNPGSTAYHAPECIRLTGPLDVPALENAFSELIRRHESLRTTFHDIDGLHIQHIEPPLPFRLEILDPIGQSPESIIEDFANRPFDLGNGPLIRAALVRCQENHHVLATVLHHIVTDGWSLGVLINELCALYSRRATAESLPHLRVQYPDCAVWLHERAVAGFPDSLHYWRGQLQGVTSPSLPRDGVAGYASADSGACEVIYLPPELTTACEALSRQLQVTPFVTLLAAFQVLLHHFTGESDIAVATSVADRERPEFQNLIGFFVNILVIRGDLSGNPAFEDLVRTMGQTVSDAFAHQHVPFDTLVDNLGLRGPDGSVGCFRVGFTYRSRTSHRVRLNGLQVEPIDLPSGAAKQDLCFLVSDTESGYRIALEYRTAALSGEIVRQMAAAFAEICGVLLPRPGCAVTTVELFRRAIADHLDIPESRIRRIMPATSSQRDLYLARVKGTIPGAHNLVSEFPLGTDIDVDRWRKAVAAVSHDDSFRTRLVMFRNRLYQVVDEGLQVPFTRLDLSSETSQSLAGLIGAGLCDNFDLSAGPQARHYLVRDRSGQETALAVFHNSALDAGSIRVMFLRLLRQYEAPGLEQPRGFSQWVDQAMRDFDTRSVLDYWTTIAQRVEALAIPPVAPERTPPGEGPDRVHGHTPGVDVRMCLCRTSDSELSGAEYRVLVEFAQSHGCKLPALILAMYGVVLDRLYGPERDFLIHNTVSARPKEFSDALGCYFYVLPFVVPKELLSGATAKLDDYLRYTHNYRRNLAGRQYFSKLEQTRILPAERTHFTYNFFNRFTEVGGSEWTLHHILENGGVHLTVVERHDSLSIRVHRDPNHASESRLSERVLWACRQLLAGVDLRDITALLPDEDATLREWNRSTDAPQSGGTLQTFAHQVALRPDSPAVKYGSEQWTYRELDIRSSRIAGAIRRQARTPEAVVAVLSDRTPYLLAALLGVLKAGAVYMPLDPRQPQQRLASMIRQSGCTCIIRSAEYADLATSLPAPSGEALLQLDLEEAANTGEPATCRFPAPDSLAYVFYTSGSTGEPKGAMIHHAGMHNHIQAKIETLQLDDNSIVIQCSSQCFDVSIWQFLSALAAGGQVYIASDREARDPVALLHAAAFQRATVLEVVPSQIAYAIQELDRDPVSKPDLAHLQVLISNAEMLTWQLARRWMRLYPHVRFLNAYGPTECSDDVAHQEVVPSGGDSGEPNVCVGRLLRNSQLYVVTPHGSLAPPLAAGEIWLGGIGVGRGYCNDPVRTAAAFVPDPFSGQPGARLYRTGDLGRLHLDGRIEVLGRIDHQVKIRGHRIELGEIEAALQSHPFVDRAIVEVRPARDGEPTLVAFIVPLHPTQWDAGAVRAHVGARVPDYMLPAAIVLLDELPLNDNGKVNRRALHWDGEVERAASAPPVGETELRLAQMWSEVLGVATIGRHDNFFALGGHSLLAIRLISRIRERLALDIALESLFSNPTIAGLAAAILEQQQLEDAIAGMDESQLDAIIAAGD